MHAVTTGEVSTFRTLVQLDPVHVDGAFQEQSSSERFM